MIINIFKPRGITSFGVVKTIRYITKEKKVGHGGTLDPFAEGVLVIATGKDTKKLTEITNDNKSYFATIKLGSTTNTLDIEGKVVKEKKIPSLTQGMIDEVLLSFQGESMQVPPMFSAKKVGGKKLYDDQKTEINNNVIYVSNIKLKDICQHLVVSKSILNDKEFFFEEIFFSEECMNHIQSGRMQIFIDNGSENLLLATAGDIGKFRNQIDNRAQDKS